VLIFGLSMPDSGCGRTTTHAPHCGHVTQLRELDKTLVIQDDNDKPLAVLLKYERFLAMQEKILKSEGQ
jgi:hypothetical protein